MATTAQKQQHLQRSFLACASLVRHPSSPACSCCNLSPWSTPTDVEHMGLRQGRFRREPPFCLGIRADARARTAVRLLTVQTMQAAAAVYRFRGISAKEYRERSRAKSGLANQSQ